MTQDSSSPVPEDCDAIQGLISECADEGQRVPDGLMSHLASCGDCAAFAQLWIVGDSSPVQDLEKPATDVDPALRRRIVEQLSAPHCDASVIPFPTSRQSRTWLSALAKVAAVLALGGLSVWLLDPRVAQHEEPRTAISALNSRALLQSVAAMERPMTREKKALREAALDGTEQLRDHLQWTFAMLGK